MCTWWLLYFALVSLFVVSHMLVFPRLTVGWWHWALSQARGVLLIRGADCHKATNQSIFPGLRAIPWVTVLPPGLEQLLSLLLGFLPLAVLKNRGQQFCGMSCTLGFPLLLPDHFEIVWVWLDGHRRHCVLLSASRQALVQDCWDSPVAEWGGDDHLYCSRVAYGSVWYSREHLLLTTLLLCL